MQNNRTTYLSLGTNQGNKLENLQKAIDALHKNIGKVKTISSVYQAKSWGFKGDDFYNICLEISTELSPEKLIEQVLQTEKSLGRIRSGSGNYEPRKIDIDILLYGDEVILYHDLIIPHPRMLERKFVLEPLAEIAGNVHHPVEKISIKKCLDNCTDSTDIIKTDLSLKNPVSLLEKFNYIAIEGNIGSGKTTLARKLGEDFNAKLVLERFADNPFLPKFYDDQERYAFPLEMSFLADRYHQLSEDLAQFDLFKNFIVSDYYIFKSLIFAQVTLPKEEYKLYRKMFDIMYKEITKPDIYVFLYQNTEQLLENIRKRGREYEQNISAEYLENIHKAYTNFIKTEEDLNTLVIDVSEFDFEDQNSYFQKIIERIVDF
ncbi:MAG: 2-amino-4-hydroxy-6-hydroxymethyldihydropteridine diphosphokinase [Bacteroidota bacterium]